MTSVVSANSHSFYHVAESATNQMASDWSTTGYQVRWYLCKFDQSKKLKIVTYQDHTFAVVITKGVPQITAVYPEEALVDAKLSDLSLSVADGAPAGTISWTYGSTTITPGNRQYQWKFVPDDTDNYTQTTGLVTIRGLMAYPVLAIMDGDHADSASTVSASKAGDVTVDTTLIQPGETVTVTPGAPSEGFRVGAVTVKTYDGDFIDVNKQKEIFTFTMPDDAVYIEVAYERLTAQTVEETISSITPPEADPVKHEENVLEAKVYYEQLEDTEKTKVSKDLLDDLHQRLAQLSCVEIGLEKHVHIAADVDAPNLYQVAGEITLDEAKGLLSGDIRKITLKLMINPLDDPNRRIDPQGSGYAIGMDLDIALVKQVDSEQAETLSETKTPVRIVVAIPEQLRAPGRRYVMLRQHAGKLDVLENLDQTQQTLTVESNLFSAYAIAYQDVERLFTVEYDSQGGSRVQAVSGVRKGSLLTAPQQPVREDYAFGGWYQEAECQSIWRFDTDTVQAEMTLYAKWTALEASPTSSPMPSPSPTTAPITAPTTAPTAKGNPQTGDDSGFPWLWLWAAACAWLACALAVDKNRRKGKQR